MWDMTSPGYKLYRVYCAEWLSRILCRFHLAFLTVSIQHFLPFRKLNKSPVLFEFLDKEDVFLDCSSVK
jgi:hypothetical protein